MSQRKPEYSLSSKSSRDEIIAVLRKLEADAADEAKTAAYAFFTTGNIEGTNFERLAAEYEGKREIIHSILWCIAGVGEDEITSNPTVDIY